MPETVYLDTTPETPEDDGSSSSNATTTTTDPEAPETDADSFSREYVEELRAESAKYRTRAKRADDLAAALWAKSVESLGKLADPSDLPMPEDADPLDPEAVTAAVDELLSRKPHLASRKPQGTVGQGKGNTDAQGLSLGGLFRSLA